MLSGYSAAQEIKHLWKFTGGFIEPQILNFERSLSLSPLPKSSLASFLLEAHTPTKSRYKQRTTIWRDMYYVLWVCCPSQWNNL